MKKLLLFLIFSGNFIRPAESEKAKYENDLLLSVLEASEFERECIINYLVFSHKSLNSNNCATKNELAENANEFFMLIPRDIQSPLLLITQSSYLVLAKKVYYSVNEAYKKEQGDKLCKPS